MTMISLENFVAKTAAGKRIGFADVQRLGRDILPDGIGSRQEVEQLAALDRRVSHADPAWGAWLVTHLVEFVVWTERPTAVVTEETARWLAAALSGAGSARSAKTARLVVRGIVEEAHAFENDALSALAALAGPSSPRRAAARTESAVQVAA